MNEPHVQVGILLSEERVECVLDGVFRVHGAGGAEVTGHQVVSCEAGRIVWNGQALDALHFEPLQPEQTFQLRDVTIGREFHWERREHQRFPGALRIAVRDGRLDAINVVPVEAYLTSVISSEMSATASAELLKAHAVISRSWLLAQVRRQARPPGTAAMVDAAGFRLRWYDREDHVGFDVCADDHCQRYQGVVRAAGTETARGAVAATRGETLLHAGAICDARFAKCCGGRMEEFATCWDDAPHPYLVSRLDRDAQQPRPDLTQEAEAARWIRSSPEAFCHTTDRRILAQVLNDYDQETTDFYRWQVAYGQDELSALVRERSGLDFGRIVDLVPVARGPSGRMWQMRIVGTARTLVIGKELEIRRTLSKSHLYSSAFVVDRHDVGDDGVPGRFVLTGAGWGHGVGLCQIGAAVMGAQGRSYRDILQHYYPGAELQALYR